MYYKRNTCSILALVLTVIVNTQSNTADTSAHFNKEPKAEKVILKNHIGFHFQRVVREITQELFISRKVDVKPIFAGIQTLKETYETMDRYCKSLPTVLFQTMAQEWNRLFLYLPEAGNSTYAEAKARCKARGMQLPEIYNDGAAQRLADYLKSEGIPHCFAGIEPDLRDSTQKFVSTGYPIWRAAQTTVYKLGTSEIVNMKHLLDNPHAYFVYTDRKSLEVFHELTSPHHTGYVGQTSYWNWSTNYSPLVAPVVCAPPWGGTFNVTSQPNKLDGLNVNPRISRAVKGSSTRKKDDPVVKGMVTEVQTALNDIQATSQVCQSLTARINESHIEAYSKMDNLLSLVDISMVPESVYKRQTHSEPPGEETPNAGDRTPRAAPLAKIFFKTGVRLIWTIFGLIQNIRTNNRITKLETAMNLNRDQIQKNSQTIDNMTQILYSHSIAIDELTTATQGLDKRLTKVEERIMALEREIGVTNNKLEAMILMDLIDSLTTRIDNSIKNGYDILEQVIHSSLKGQTSPLILPADQIEVVQNEIRKVSVAILDTDFSRMQSVVVANPSDPTMLLVVVNAAATSRRNLELIKMVAVPHYIGTGAYIPMLDYQSVVLDQLAATFTILEAVEEESCLNGRCYLSNMEQPIFSQSCGIPQFFDRSLDSCTFESIVSNGIYLKPMMPDGVIFSMKDEVTSQLFCKEDSIIGPVTKLNGSGVMQLPTGCLLSVTNDQGINVKVKGQPRYYAMDIDDINLASNNILNVLSSGDMKNISNLTPMDALLQHHLSSVRKDVEQANHHIADHNNRMWLLTGLIICLALVLILAAALLYRTSYRFRAKVRTIRDNVAELSHRFTKAEADIEAQTPIIRRMVEVGSQQMKPPPMQPRNWDTLLTKFKWQRHSRNIDEDHTYVNMSDLQGSVTGTRPKVPQKPVGLTSKTPFLNPMMKIYPTLTPSAPEKYPMELPSKECDEIMEQCRELDEVQSQATTMLSEFSERRLTEFQ